MTKLGARGLLLFVAFAACLCGVLILMYRAAQEKRYGLACSAHLMVLGEALRNYEVTYHCLPMAAEPGPDEKPWRSWRSQIYPRYIEASPPIYDEFACWDAPSNMRLLNAPYTRYPSIFTCPRSQPTSREGIDYVVVTGALTAFPKTGHVKLSEISDGLENTILIVESINCCPDWTEPRDLDFDTMSFAINSMSAPSVSSDHPQGPLVYFADGEVFHASPTTTEAELKAMLTIAGHENIRRRDLLERRVLSR